MGRREGGDGEGRGGGEREGGRRRKGQGGWGRGGEMGKGEEGREGRPAGEDEGATFQRVCHQLYGEALVIKCLLPRGLGVKSWDKTARLHAHLSEP